MFAGQWHLCARPTLLQKLGLSTRTNWDYIGKVLGRALSQSSGWTPVFLKSIQNLLKNIQIKDGFLVKKSKWQRNGRIQKEKDHEHVPKLPGCFSKCSICFSSVWTAVPKNKMKPTNPNAHTYVTNTDVETHFA